MLLYGLKHLKADPGGEATTFDATDCRDCTQKLQFFNVLYTIRCGLLHAFYLLT